MDKITVLCPNGHRVTVTTSRHASLSEVLEEVCKKKNFDPKRHVLQHHGRTLDLSLSIHLSNLPRNGQLEMVPAEEGQNAAGKSSSVVNICLQLESGERIMKDFSPDQTLADIFKNAKDEGKIEEKVINLFILCTINFIFYNFVEINTVSTSEQLNIQQNSFKKWR